MGFSSSAVPIEPRERNRRAFRSRKALLRDPCPPVPAFNFIRRERQSLVGFLYPDIRVFRARVHRHLNNYPATTARAQRTINRIRLHQAPLPTRAPVAIEVIKLVRRIFIRVLFPIRIAEPHRVRCLIVLALQCRKELARRFPFGIVTIVINHPRSDENENNHTDDMPPASSVPRWIVLLRIHQRHGGYKHNSGSD